GTDCRSAWPAGAGGGIGGGGTTNSLPKFSGATTLGDSSISDDGAHVAITVPGGGLQVFSTNASTGPNVFAGYFKNGTNTSVVGATISGGGSNFGPNIVFADFGAVGGGRSNFAGESSTIAGGEHNYSDHFGTVGGGDGN